MRYQKAKLFWHAQNGHKKVFCIHFDEKEEYYTFLKKYHDCGYRQTILTSEIILHLMEYFVIKKNLLVYKIVFMEEDLELFEEINNLLRIIASNRVYFGKLTEKIKFLSEKSSIEIKRIYFKGRNKKNEAVDFYLQANGIIGINEQCYEAISNEIGRQIMEDLF